MVETQGKQMPFKKYMAMVKFDNVLIYLHRVLFVNILIFIFPLFDIPAGVPHHSHIIV